MIHYGPSAKGEAAQPKVRSTLHVRRAAQALSGTLRASPSKSYTHRAILLSLVAPRVEVTNALLSGDTLASLSAARVLGARFEKLEGARGRLLLERGEPEPAPRAIDCGNSGTTLRIATPIAATLAGLTVLAGDASLARRPMGPLVEALASLGARHARCTGTDGRPPVEIEGPIHGGTVRLPGDVSSQFVSGLLIAGARLAEGIRVDLSSPLRSAPYVGITLRLLGAIGIHAEHEGARARVAGGRDPKPSHIVVPGDWSSAAFPLAAAAVTGGSVRIEGLPDDPLQGDRAIADLLARMGCEVRRAGDSVTLSTPGPLRGVEMDLGDTPDMVPIAAVLGACAQGVTTLTGAPHARLKESDRIGLTARNLRALGADVAERPDGLVIRGGARLHGGAIESQGDHRQVMAFAVAGLAAAGETTITQGDGFVVSYPRFAEDLSRLGASCILDEERI